MSFMAAFGAQLAMNLLGSKRATPPPVERSPTFSTSGYRGPTSGRRGSQATKSRAAQVNVGPDVAMASNIKSTVLRRMLRETADTIKQAKATKA